MQRAQNIVDGLESERRPFSRYAVYAVVGFALGAIALAAGFYFWWSQNRASVSQLSTPPAAVSDTTEAARGVQRSYVEGISVEADVAARSVAVTSSFHGAEIVLFGAIDDSKFSHIGDAPYDVVVAIQGRDEHVVLRKKNNVAGMWINTESASFKDVPSFYALQSSRPLAEIAGSAFFSKHNIGIENLLSTPSSGAGTLPASERKGYSDALLRLKKKTGLYVERENSVTFNGRVLFRSTIDLPPSVLVGNLIARVYLIRDEEMLASYTSKIRMERQGLMRLMHQLAFSHQLLYGVLAVLMAAAAGIGASMVFRKSGH